MGRTRRLGGLSFARSLALAAGVLAATLGCSSDEDLGTASAQDGGAGGSDSTGSGGRTTGGAPQNGGRAGAGGSSRGGGGAGGTGGTPTGGTAGATGGSPSGGTSGSGGTQDGGTTDGAAGTGGIADSGTAGSTGGAPTGGTASASGGSPSGGATGGTGPLDGGTGGNISQTGGASGDGGRIGSTGGAGPDASGGSGGQSPNPEGGVGTPDGSDASGDAAPPLPPPGNLWNDGSLNPATAVLVCFTTAPHIEWHSQRRCDGQATADLSCSGDPFTGTDVASLRDRFMALMQDTWSRATNLEFYANECPTAGGVVDTTKLPNQLAVTFVTKGADSEPLTEDVTGLGKHDFASDLHVDWKGLLANDPEAVRTILRESGRILGFPYEWLRGTEPAAPQACPSDHTPDPNFDFLARPGALVDFFSVMDRCTPTSSTQPGLSPGDVIGAQQTYGIKQNGGLVGYRGYCADVAGANTATGSTVIGFPCRSAPNDSFCRCSQTAPRFEANFGGEQRCLAVSGNAVSSSFTPVVSNACDGSLDGQKFSASNVEWRALGNMCLTANNGKIELAFCDGSTAQKWNFFDVDSATTPTWDQIQHASTGECVTTQTLDGGYGEQLGLASCSAADPRQHFQYRGEGFIAFSGSSLWCMNVLGGTLTPGSPLGLWDGCNYRPFFNSQFHVSGSFKSLGQCLSMQDKPGNFPDVGVEPCTTGARREVWDFHF